MGTKILKPRPATSVPRKLTIARYWLGPLGQARFPENRCTSIWLPACFACAHEEPEWAEPDELKDRWVLAGLERAHVRPRSLGGCNCAANVVLLCHQCHRDAPDVADQTFMMRWMAARETVWERCARRMHEVLADLRAMGVTDADFVTLSGRGRELSQRVEAAWAVAGWHGFDQSTGTMSAVVVQVVREMLATA